MGMSSADFLLKRLHENGVRRIYGYPGDGIIAIVGEQSRMALGGNYQQEVDLQVLFKDVAHEYCQMAYDPAQIRHLVDRAHRIALDQRSVTCLIVPNDLGEEPAVTDPPQEHGTVHSSPGWNRPRIVPTQPELEQAAEILNAGSKVAMLVGQGALQATEQVMELAEKLGAGVAKALLGRTVIDDNLPFVTGSIGLLGTKPSWTLMDECDTLLMVGSSFPYSEFLPEPGQARGVQIDLDGRMLNIRYPMELGLVGDAKATLAELIPLVQHKTDRVWREQLEGEIRDWWK